ncbi:CU044_5270 family protein [Actinomadura fibrosa]|uniref:CU044_5270 family protein n=1 Tax=Actinomadura fibrosa TaxID=111802 RepID=A0ABW2XC18_9ACTN|nr:CU044_5270 family protein [Actinomadura fibrosa]
MNELTSVRELYGDPPPPTDRTVAAARVRMTQPPPRRRPQVRFSRWSRVGLGLVAAGAAAAVAVAAAGSGTSGPAGPSTSVDLDRRAVLEAAAKAEALPTGRYWYSDEISGQSYIVRSRTGEYAITGAHSEMYHWIGAEVGTGEGYASRDLPAKPLTAEDEAAWRRAGSPSSFRVWSNDHYYTYRRTATPWTKDKPDASGGGRFFLVGGRKMTTEEVRRLPSDPATLARMFFGPPPEKKGLTGKGRKAEQLRAAAVSPPRWPFRVVAALLRTAPLEPKVRAGLMRALAAQPEVRALGKATDPLGRTGVALAVDDMSPTGRDGEFGAPKEEQGTFSTRSELIFDQATGKLLAEQTVLTAPGGPYRNRKPGFVVYYSLIRDLGWTDAKPKPPVELPF